MTTEDTATHLAAAAGPGRVFVGRHPAERLTGSRLPSRDEGGAVVLGRLPGGAGLGHLGMVADIALSQAALAGTDSGQGQLTVGLDLRLLSAVPHPGPDGDPEPEVATHARREQHTVEARATRVGASATARVTQVVVTVDGRPVAVGSGRIVTAHRGHRPLPQVHDTEPWTQVAATGELDAELALTLSSRTDGRAELTATASARLQNARPMLHGGVHLRLAELAMTAALSPDATGDLPLAVGAADGLGAVPTATLDRARRTPDPTPGPRLLADLNLEYLRPVPADGATAILVEADVVRRGRRLAVVDARLRGTDGTLLTRAHGTFLPPDDLG